MKSNKVQGADVKRERANEGIQSNSPLPMQREIEL